MKIATYKKYTDQVALEFPDIDKAAIERVARHGFAMLTHFQFYRQDVYLTHNLQGFYFYFGENITDPKYRFEHSRKKMHQKLRMMSGLRKDIHDGYYYFALSDEQYECFQRGESLPITRLYKLELESDLYIKATHRLRVKREDDGRWWLPLDEYETKDAQYLREGYAERPKPTNHTSDVID
jgi:hypothetical protein